MGAYEGSVTLVEMSLFESKQCWNKTFVKWTTASETDNVGFNLYRAESEDGPYEQINKKLIPAKGSPTEGVSYKYADRRARRGTDYYKLEDIDLNGMMTMHGPVRAMR